MTFSEGKKRSAMSPKKRGAKMAAMGALSYAPPMMVPRSFVPRASARLTNHDPQAKNWRNIMMESLVRMLLFANVVSAVMILWVC